MASAAVLILMTPLFGVADDAARDGAAPVVATVRFQVASPYRISYGELAGLVTVRPGDVLTEESVRGSIQGLSAKPIFTEIAAFVREEGGKADLLFYLRPSPSIYEVEVAGNKKVSSAQILSASRIRRGTRLEDRDFRDAEAAVKKALHSKGFTAASVSVSALCNLENGAGKVKIEVREGPTAVVRTIDLPGASYLTRKRMLEALGVSPGEFFDHRRWETGIRKLRVAYK
ncbi:MAG: yaeT1, partial [Actinobacteria bacterium]|nr:yaeT1 [Actinomycetota bacterium]